ncbi:unnamed protein product [Ambrosiozyma monospora]|uniref:Unnamed protein product n=1 Tax=Ambrosiozyma monospora TaxID=43982 RepID=A0ACB5U2S2_AMBMO|nr:unnamed protein product [Ambrosiozyma monospora]
MYGQMPMQPQGSSKQPQMPMNAFGYPQFPMAMGGGPGGNPNAGGSMNANSNNTRSGNTTTGADGKINQELFVPQKHIGLVIGKGGKNLKDIRSQTGCYVKVNDEVPGSTERNLTLMGNIYGIQSAIMLINNKIENEKMRQQREQREHMHGLPHHSNFSGSGGNGRRDFNKSSLPNPPEK